MSPESPPTWNTDDNKLIVTHNFFFFFFKGKYRGGGVECQYLVYILKRLHIFFCQTQTLRT